MRTKEGVANSYKSSDEINQFEWERVTTFQKSVAYVRGPIALRKREYLFRMHTLDEIDAHFTTLSENFNIVAFALQNEWKKYIVVFNANRSDTIFRMEKGKYAILVEDNQVFPSKSRSCRDGKNPGQSPYNDRVIRRKPE